MAYNVKITWDRTRIYPLVVLHEFNEQSLPEMRINDSIVELYDPFEVVYDFNRIYATRHLKFTSGSVEPAVNDIIVGATSNADATIKHVGLESGSWVGGDAAGTFTITNQAGVFNAVEDLNIFGGSTNIATTAGFQQLLISNIQRVDAGDTLEFGAGVITYEISTNLDAILQGFVTYTISTDLDSILGKVNQELLSDLDSILRQLNQEILTNLDAQIFKEYDISTNLNSILSKLFEITTNLDSILAGVRSVQTDLDSILRRSFEQYVELDSILAGRGLQATNLNAIIEKVTELQTNLNSVLAVYNNEIQTNLDALLLEGGTISAALDAIKIKLDQTREIFLDALLEIQSALEVQLDALLEGHYTRFVNLDSLLRGTYQRSLDLDGILLDVDRTHRCWLQAILLLTSQLNVNLDATLVSALNERFVVLDAQLLDVNRLLSVALDASLFSGLRYPHECFVASKRDSYTAASREKFVAQPDTCKDRRRAV